MTTEERILAFLNRRGTVVWIGAGLSRELHYPDWSELVELLCDACDISADDDRSFDALLDRAEECRQANQAAYERVMLEEFGEDARRTTTRWIHRYLLRLRLSAYVTTNFDHLLARETTDPAVGDCTVAWYPTLLDYDLYSDHPVIYHVHGLAGRDNDGQFRPLVLTRSDFESAYHASAGPTRSFVARLLLQHPILFIGVGKGLAEDSYLRELLIGTREMQAAMQATQPSDPPQRIALTTRRTGLPPDEQALEDRAAGEASASLCSLGIDPVEVDIPVSRGVPDYAAIDDLIGKVAQARGLRRTVRAATGFDSISTAGDAS